MPRCVIQHGAGAVIARDGGDYRTVSTERESVVSGRHIDEVES